MGLPDLVLVGLILTPLLGAWALALADIARRPDASRTWKSAWVVLTFVLPFIGTLVYLLFRPTGLTDEEREGVAAKRP
ncbi:MAG: PLD nuclease N-terminal domain-containing protein [Candidatus Limnocylindrales bacterium]